MSLKTNNFEFILLEDETNPKFNKYNEIFKNSQKLAEPLIIYKISILEFDSTLYDLLHKYKSIQIPVNKKSIVTYSSNPNIVFENDLIIFKNTIDIKDILDNLDIKSLSDSHFEISTISNIVKVIKQKCDKKNINNIIFPIMCNELNTPIVIVIDKTKVIGYLIYNFRIEDNSIYIDYIEVNPDYRNESLCKKMISYLISQKKDINKYELLNVGGLSGYSCYVDAFTNNNFDSNFIENLNNNSNNNSHSISSFSSRSSASIKSYKTNNTKKYSKNNLNKIRLSRKNTKLNLSKNNNIVLNKQFNGDMIFIRQ